MKLKIIIINILLISLVGCSVSRTDTPSINHKESTSNVNTEAINPPPTQEKSLDTQSNTSNNSNSTSGPTNTSAQLTLANQLPLTTSLTNIEGYHDTIQNIAEINLQLDLDDSRIAKIVEHISLYEYNYENNNIGEVAQPDSLYVLANKLNHLPSDYVPEVLVEPNILFSFDSKDEKRNLRPEAGMALESMFQSATNETLTLYAVSGYRSYKRQESIYNNKVETRGLEEADKVSARPGHSEHQTGLAMDISSLSVGLGLEYAFGQTPEGIWVAEHAHEYGFIIRYPEDKIGITGYNYEPWHLRYVGDDIASFIFENQITLEQLYSSIQNQLKDN